MKLTGWRIDIKSESQLAEEEAYANQEWAEGEWIEDESGELVWRPAEGGDPLSAEEWSRGEGPAEALPAIGILLALTVVLTLIAVRVFRWDEI